MATGYTWQDLTGGLSEFYVDDLSDAIAHVESILDSQGIDSPVWAEQADADGTNDDGLQCWRLLVWESEEDAVNDNGGKSIGELCWCE